MANCRYALVAVILLVVMPSSGHCDTVSEVKSRPAGMPVSVTGAVTYARGSDCYVQSTTGFGGIWVQGDLAGVEIGEVITATGMYSVAQGECVILNATVSTSGESFNAAPLAMPNRSVGGGLSGFQQAASDYGFVPILGTAQYSWRWHPAGGANNTGLLIKTWGTVESVYYSPVSEARWFYLDDGSSLVSDLGDVGVLVYSDADVKQGQFITATGISSVEPSLDDPERLVRVVRTRSPDDVVTLWEPEPEYPFSDEFNGPSLDPRWAAFAENGSLSLTSDPGWLALIAEPSTVGSEIFQMAPGDWVASVKVRATFGGSPAAMQWLMICYGPHPWFQSRPVGAVGRNAGEEPAVYLAGTEVAKMEGNTCYLRLRRMSETVYLSASFDGIDYSEEIPQELPDSLFLGLVARCSHDNQAFIAYVDYVRITRVGE